MTKQKISGILPKKIYDTEQLKSGNQQEEQLILISDDALDKNSQNRKTLIFCILGEVGWK